MNIVLQATRPNGFSSKSGNSPVAEFTGDWYIVSIRKTTMSKLPWGVRGKILNADGSLHMVCEEKYFADMDKAKAACRKQVKRKKTLKKYVEVEMSMLPAEAINHLEPDCESWMTPEDMLKMIAESRKERYVWFKDISGMEEYFRFGLEYLAYITDEPDILTVIDEYGTKRECMTERFNKIEYTEDAEEAIGKFGKLTL